jgi:hypothetical protein
MSQDNEREEIFWPPCEHKHRTDDGHYCLSCGRPTPPALPAQIEIGVGDKVDFTEGL